MILYNGKAKNLTRELITWLWLQHTRLIEPLESVDFSKN